MNTTAAINVLQSSNASKRQRNAAAKVIASAWLVAKNARDTKTIAELDNVFHAYACYNFLPNCI
jgi:hypothetical protein